MTALLAPAEVSQILRVSLSTVRRLTVSGELTHVRVSDRRPRYRPEDVIAFLETRRAHARPGQERRAIGPTRDDGAEATAPTVTTSPGDEVAGRDPA